MEPGTALLISKHLDRIDANRAPRWSRRREGSCDAEQTSHREIRHRIEWLHTEQEHGDELTKAGRRNKANDSAEGDHASCAAQNQTQHARSGGTQCNANSELARALLD